MKFIDQFAELNQFIIYVTGIITAIFSWFFVKKKFQQKDLALKDGDIELNSVQMVERNLSLYQNMIDDFSDRYKREIEDLKNHVKELNRSIEQIKQSSKEERIQHRKEIMQMQSKYESIIRDLKTENQKLRN